jgi:hypothetical protein
VVHPCTRTGLSTAPGSDHGDPSTSVEGPGGVTAATMHDEPLHVDASALIRDRGTSYVRRTTARCLPSSNPTPRISEESGYGVRCDFLLASSQATSSSSGVACRIGREL